MQFSCYIIRYYYDSKGTTMRADLHIHSRYSDGSLWPAEIASLFSGAGLEAACVTDHDTLGGYSEFAVAARICGLQTWPAVEIDCVDAAISYKSEILAYFPDGRHAETATFLAAGCAERASRLAALFKRAAVLFRSPELDFGAIVAQRLAGRPAGLAEPDPTAFRYAKTDVFLALREAGIVAKNLEYREFKKAYFDTGLFSDVRFAKPELSLVSGLVARDGGVLVVPHIAHEFGDSLQVLREGTDRLDRMLGRFRELGVSGVESYNYRTPESAAINAFVTERARRYGFFMTFGSDFHSLGTTKDGPGSFFGDFNGFTGRG